MSIVLQGSTSGSITLQEPAVAGSTVLSLPATSGTLITTGSTGQVIPKAALPTGSVLQVNQVTVATQTATNIPTYADTGLTLSITPISSTSKILIIAYCGMCKKTAVDAQMNIQIVRGSTSIFVAAALNNDAASTESTNPTLVYLDSPSTTSSTQYKIQVANRDGVGTMNFNNNGTATMTLMEIAA